MSTYVFMFALCAFVIIKLKKTTGSFIVKESIRLMEDNHSKTADILVKRYIDNYSSCFILCAYSKEIDEDFDFSLILKTELENYIDFEGTVSLWERLDKGTLADVIVAGIFDFCEDSTQTIPYNSEDYYKELWHSNIDKGLKNLKISLN